MKYPNFNSCNKYKEGFEICDISELKGKVIESIEGLELNSDQVEITTNDGWLYIMYHSQDCCEFVRIEDVYGDKDDLIGSPILEAEERTNGNQYDPYGSHTWTFYAFATSRGWVDIRWLGESNGYYSEAVDIYKKRLTE